jgi:arginyl-tRNA synthetase
VEIAQLISEGKTEEEAKKQAQIILEAQEMLLKKLVTKLFHFGKK